MKDSCSSISKLLEKYFDQEVTEEEKSLVEDHLLNCLSCQDTLKSMEGLRDLIKTPVEKASQKEDFQWVWQRIQGEIRSRERPILWETIQSWFDLSSLFRKRVWVPTTVAIAILIFIVTPILFKKTPFHPDLSIVEYVESETYNVMIYESEKGNITVIWLFEGPEKELPTS